MLDTSLTIEYASAAIYLTLHAFDDNAQNSLRSAQNFSDPAYGLIAILPSGGAMKNITRLQLSLEETFSHLRTSVENFPQMKEMLDEYSLTIFSSSERSKQVRCWALLFALHFGGMQHSYTSSALISAITIADFVMSGARSTYIFQKILLSTGVKSIILVGKWVGIYIIELAGRTAAV
jgi:hypothetical protein